MRQLSTSKEGLEASRSAALAAPGSGQMPPIIYKNKGNMSDGDKANWPKTDRQAMSNLKRLLKTQMTLEQANFVVSPSGKERVKKALRDKARSEAYFDTGWFTDGSDKLDKLADEYRDKAWQTYQNAALELIEEEKEKRQDPGPGGGGGGGGDRRPRRGARQAGLGIGTAGAIILSAGMLGGGYYLYQSSQS